MRRSVMRRSSGGANRGANGLRGTVERCTFSAKSTTLAFRITDTSSVACTPHVKVDDAQMQMPVQDLIETYKALVRADAAHGPAAEDALAAKLAHVHEKQKYVDVGFTTLRCGDTIHACFYTEQDESLRTMLARVKPGMVLELNGLRASVRRERNTDATSAPTPAAGTGVVMLTPAVGSPATTAPSVPACAAPAAAAAAAPPPPAPAAATATSPPPPSIVYETNGKACFDRTQLSYFAGSYTVISEGPSEPQSEFCARVAESFHSVLHGINTAPKTYDEYMAENRAEILKLHTSALERARKRKGNTAAIAEQYTCESYAASRLTPAEAALRQMTFALHPLPERYVPTAEDAPRVATLWQPAEVDICADTSGKFASVSALCHYTRASHESVIVQNKISAKRLLPALMCSSYAFEAVRGFIERTTELPTDVQLDVLTSGFLGLYDTDALSKTNDGAPALAYNSNACVTNVGLFVQANALPITCDMALWMLSRMFTPPTPVAGARAAPSSAAAVAATGEVPRATSVDISQHLPAEDVEVLCGDQKRKMFNLANVRKPITPAELADYNLYMLLCCHVSPEERAAVVLADASHEDNAVRVSKMLYDGSITKAIGCAIAWRPIKGVERTFDPSTCIIYAIDKSLDFRAIDDAALEDIHAAVLARCGDIAMDEEEEEEEKKEDDANEQQQQQQEGAEKHDEAQQGDGSDSDGDSSDDDGSAASTPKRSARDADLPEGGSAKRARVAADL